MKRVWRALKCLAVGLLTAAVGLGFADIIRRAFEMDYGDSFVLGYGIYLCIVIVSCTCIIVSELGPKNEDE